MRYPTDPNRLFRDATSLNELARDLRDEGWIVKLEVAENGTRVCVSVNASRPCDPAPRTEEK